MRWFIVGRPEEDRVRALAGLAGRLGHAPVQLSTIAALAADARFADEVRPVVLVVHEAEIASAIRLTRPGAAGPFVVAVTDSIAPEHYKELVRTGCGEWVALHAIEHELPDILAGRDGIVLRSRTAKVISVAPSKGGSGATTVAIETAIRLATRHRRREARVALLDLNLDGGTLADVLNVEPRFDLAEIAGRLDRLDEQLVDVFTSRHASGVHVFAAPPRPAEPEALDPQIVFAFIDALSARYDWIVLDLPVVTQPWTDGLLRGSDAVVVTGGGQVPALRRLASRLTTLGGTEGDRVAAVVNACETDLMGRVRHRAEIERALPGRRVFFVRRDGRGVTAASNAGASLMETAPNSRALRDMRRVSDWIEEMLGPSPSREGAT